LKLIEAMKQLKALAIKAEDLRKKVGLYCADLSMETPTYPDQKRQIDEWIQAHHDILKEILRLRIAIQRTNLATQVAIQIEDKPVTKSIAEWIHRRRDLANLERDMWAKLTDRGLKEQNLQTAVGGAVTEIRIRRYYEPAKKDWQLALFSGEPGRIDATLEVANATTELIES